MNLKKFNKKNLGTRSSCGFTFVEILVSLSLLSIGFLIFLEFSRTMFLTKNQLDGAQSMNDHQKIFDILNSDPSFCYQAFRGSNNYPLLYKNKPLSVDHIVITDLNTKKETRIMGVDDILFGGIKIKEINLQPLYEVPAKVIEMEDGQYKVYTVKTQLKGEHQETKKQYYREWFMSLYTGINKKNLDQIVFCQMNNNLDLPEFCASFGGTLDVQTKKCNLPKKSSQLGTCNFDQEYVSGFDNNGNILCERLPASQPTIPPIKSGLGGFRWTLDTSSPACDPHYVATQFDCSGKCSSARMKLGCSEVTHPEKLNGPVQTITAGTSGQCPSGAALVGLKCGHFCSLPDSPLCSNSSCASPNMDMLCQHLQGVQSFHVQETQDLKHGGCPNGQVACGFNCTGNCGTRKMKLKCCVYSP